MAEKSGFLSRWALRKQQVQEGETPVDEPLQEIPPQAEAVAEAEPETQTALDPLPETETQEEKLLTAEDLPDPSGIEVGGSFASFMAKNVDPAVKTAALRTLWKQPHFNEIDGLLEYALDYSNQPKLSAEASAELAKKVFRHVLEKEEPEEAEEALAEAETSATEAEAAPPQLAEQSAPQSPTDNLDGDVTAEAQNATDAEAETHKPVV
ncbi:MULTISPECIES: DUF3306 domain-containing protein [Shewanella]|uniref:DUF3306 domain-containing protein n=1 Tax=Shewanella TaxID=22 RepID=UPI000C349416|nr:MULTISPECIES: DUF3306 domain-containing protein [Shewanella]TVP09132.1 hypothetical protein AYI96_17270 [Shewanella sp. MSW]GHB19179.1 hypothetical protein GCM10007107_35190 [Shewanella indica]